MKLSDDAHQVIPSIPSGSIGLDLALGIGGNTKRPACERGLRPGILR